MITDILLHASKNDCSDIHLVTGSQPIVRRIGSLERLQLPPINEKEILAWLMELLTEEQLSLFYTGRDIDSAYTDWNGNRYRINVYRQQGKPAVAMRLLKNDIPTIDQLGLPQVLKDLADLPRGLILVTGPTGSGKSTTLAAMIDHINRRKSRHILTLEDPIEYIYTAKQSLINQREIHRDVTDFKTGLRSALREDPDVILVGEMRDFETISLAITAAETGHLVFSTLHTIGAPNTIDRIIDAFPTNQQSQIRTQLATVLKASISQILVPKADMTGRVAIHEIMLMNDAVANQVRENKIFQIASSIQTGQKQGMQTLESDLVKKVNTRQITYETALESSSNPEFFKRLYNGI
jgi:twitching motility protein PilT